MLKRLIAVVALIGLAQPAGAATAVDTSNCDATTITNTSEVEETYRIQVYEGVATKTLGVGESYTFESIDQAGHWAVWDSAGSVVASGEFCTVVHVTSVDGEWTSIWVPVSDKPEPEVPHTVDVPASTPFDHVARNSAGVFPI